MLNDDFADLQPCQPQTDEEKIAVLLDLLSDGFENDADLDVVRDAALHHLLRFPQLPERTIQVIRAILSDEDDSDLVISRKVAAIDVLAHMGQQAKPALAILNDLLPRRCRSAFLSENGLHRKVKSVFFQGWPSGATTETIRCTGESQQPGTRA